MSQPKLITKPFADDALPGYVNEIPKENPVGAPEQNASWAIGFPPITMTDIDDGGLPPNGEDMNGVLRAITEHNLFIGGGGVYEFADEYITEVGGYNKGAVLVSDDKTALWMSIQDNNTQNFNGATKTQWRRIAFTELDSTLTSIQNALNTKADKSVTITAGDGLTGGGTLAGDRVLAVNSSVVRTDRTITSGTGLSGGGSLAANRTLSVNYGTTAGTAAQGNDVRITGAAQKSANLSDLASASAARQNLGLGTAATGDTTVGNADVTKGRLLKVGDLGSNKHTLAVINFNDLPELYPYSGLIPVMSDAGSINLPPKSFYYHVFQTFRSDLVTQIAIPYRVDDDGFFLRSRFVGVWSQWREVLHTGNILPATGQSTQYPMTQKAVTDALNTKVGLTGNQTVGGIKTFSSFPITPSTAPTASYQAANKKYVDDSAIGVGQTWQNVTGSRVAGTTYTNTTGRSIQVSITFDPVGSGPHFTINGVDVLSSSDTGHYNVACIVPARATYRLGSTGGAVNLKWTELR